MMPDAQPLRGQWTAHFTVGASPTKATRVPAFAGTTHFAKAVTNVGNRQ